MLTKFSSLMSIYVDRHQHPSGSDVDFLFQNVFFCLPKTWKDKGVITLTTLGKELIIKFSTTAEIPVQNWLVSSFTGQHVLPPCLQAAISRAMFGCYWCSWLSALQVLFHQCDNDPYLSSGCKSRWDDLAVPQGRQLFHALLNPNAANYGITPNLKKAFFFVILNLLPTCPSWEHCFLLECYQKPKLKMLFVKHHGVLIE